MSWSYDATNLTTDTDAGRLNSVRLLLGDTDTTDQQLQNEEITFSLAQSNDNIYFAAAWSAKNIASLYARRVTTDLSGALSANYSDLIKHYTALSENLEYQGKKAGAVIGVKAGGLTISQVEAVRANTNRIDGSFRRDQFHNPPSYSTPEYE